MNISSLLRRWPRLFDLAKRAYRRARPKDPVYLALKSLYDSKRDVSFLQVGSNDGITNDPLREFVVRSESWRGIFIEPVPSLFADLQSNYAYLRRTDLRFLNLAVGRVSGSVPFYRIRPDRLTAYPSWARQISSLAQSHILRHFAHLPHAAEDIEEISVPCFSPEDLADLCGLDGLDVLHIDIEGGEGDLLSQFPFDRVRPALLIFEHVHLPADVRHDISARLRAFGYRLIEADMDTIALT